MCAENHLKLLLDLKIKRNPKHWQDVEENYSTLKMSILPGIKVLGNRYLENLTKKNPTNFKTDVNTFYVLSTHHWK